MAQSRDIKYINKEFDDFRFQLVEYAKSYFPDTYNDFSESSPGMMFLEMAAYVGDILSFYQDQQLQETFLQHSQNPSNLYSLAYMLGYRPRVTSVSEVELEVSQRVAAVAGSNYTPNWDQAVRIGENAQIKADVPGEINFLTKNVVDFKFSSSYDPTSVKVYEYVGTTPSEFLLTKKVKAVSGEIKTTSVTFTTAEKFATIEIEDDNIVGVLDIVDSDENYWYEVPFLAQDTIFKKEVSTESDLAEVPYNLVLEKVPRRFVTRFTSKDKLQIQFGSGVVPEDDTSFLPSPTQIESINRNQVINKLDYSYDPSNFLFTKAYGLAPSNTTLTVRYVTGGGIESNVPANTITRISEITLSSIDGTYESTVSFNNTLPARGGRDKDSIRELRENSLKAFSEQQRVVTLQDYTIRALSLPPLYGSISKVYATQDINTNSNYSVLDRNPLAISLYVLAYDNDKHLVKATNGLKNNLKTYLSQYMIITDAIDIKDAFVINIGVKYEVVILPNYAARDVLLNCNLKLQEHFDISNWSINQPINLSTLYVMLDKVKGVQTVKKIEIENKNGGNYSKYGYDVKGATRDRIVYPSYDPSIFEVKYPELDIEGRVTTL